MTASELLSKPEFWSALFGALAAFLLGALATWWSNYRAKQAAANIALLTLSQMYSLMENLRHHVLDIEPRRASSVRPGGGDPFSFELRSLVGVTETPPRLAIESLGFAATSHDPDIFNRLMTVERGYLAMLEMVELHREKHVEFEERLSAIDPTGQRPIRLEELPGLVGTKLLVEIDIFVEELKRGLPETCEMLLAVGGQLRSVLAVQLPFGRLIGFTAAPRVIFRHIGATGFSAYRSQAVFGI